MPLVPLLKNNVIAREHIVVNAYSGVSGAGLALGRLLTGMLLKWIVIHGGQRLQHPREGRTGMSGLFLRAGSCGCGGSSQAPRKHVPARAARGFAGLAACPGNRRTDILLRIRIVAGDWIGAA